VRGPDALGERAERRAQVTGLPCDRPHVEQITTSTASTMATMVSAERSPGERTKTNHSSASPSSCAATMLRCSAPTVATQGAMGVDIHMNPGVRACLTFSTDQSWPDYPDNSALTEAQGCI
jgi:hypothetical protein